MSRSLTALYLGRRGYGETLGWMEELAELRRHGRIGDSLLFVEHDPVITLGRAARAQNLLLDPSERARLGVAVFETRRGGDVTLHAPGQLVTYPIVDLRPDRADVRKYVQTLTDVMADITRSAGIDAGTNPGKIGLWADAAQPDRWRGPDSATAPVKLGAVGVRISRWITSHGFALNLTTDLRLFDWIVPCGIRDFGVSSIAQLCGDAPSVREGAELALVSFERAWSANATWHTLDAIPSETLLPTLVEHAT